MKKELTVISKVQPKPTKAEIVDALTQLEVQRRNDKSKEDAARRAEFDKEIEAALISYFKEIGDKAKPQVRWSIYNSGSSYANISFDIQSIPKAVITKMKEADKLPTRPREYRFFDVRKEILNAARGIDETKRVSRLLNNEESRASLEKLLDTLSE